MSKITYSKFIFHTEWIDYFRELLEDSLDTMGTYDDDLFITAFILFEQIAQYAESGEYSFNDSDCQQKAEELFLKLKPRIDADLKELRETEVCHD